MTPVRFAALLCLPLLTACVTPAPFVTAYNGDSVTVTQPLGGAIGAVYAQARETCQRGGKGTSELASSQPGPNYTTDHLFLCLD